MEPDTGGLEWRPHLADLLLVLLFVTAREENLYIRKIEITRNSVGNVRFVEAVSPQEVETIETALLPLEANERSITLARQWMEAELLGSYLGNPEKYIRHKFLLMMQTRSTLAEEPDERDKAMKYLSRAEPLLLQYTDGE